jgi:hypothetical protein
MIYISSNDKIMMKNCHDKPIIEIVNNTGYLPLHILSNIILMDNYKLYTVLREIGYKLFELNMTDNTDYIVDQCDFNEEFVKMNSSGDYYQIVDKSLHKIPVIAKNSSSIANVKFEIHDYIVYINLDNSLILFDRNTTCSIFLDINVNSLIFYKNDRYSINIICKKDNQIICYVFGYDNHTNFDTYVVTYNSSAIKKKLGEFVLAKDTIYRFAENRYTRRISPIPLIKANDFNVHNGELIILNDMNEIISVRLASGFYVLYDAIYIDTNGWFKKKVHGVKSAANILLLQN